MGFLYLSKVAVSEKSCEYCLHFRYGLLDCIDTNLHNDLRHVRAWICAGNEL